MSPIVSPTTTERMLRTLGLLGLFSLFSGWFIYDGNIGYPEHNIKKAIESLDPVPDDLPPIHQDVNQESTESWVFDSTAEPRDRAEIIEQFGPAGWENPSGDRMCYFGPGGMLTLKVSGDQVLSGDYQPGDKPDSELMWQKLLGAIMLPVALIMACQLVRVITTRVTLDDNGLKVRGRPVIPFDAMTGIDAAKYRKKGFLDLSYTQSGKNKKVRLDDYVIRDFKAMITEICRRNEFDNPLPASGSRTGAAAP